MNNEIITLQKDHLYKKRKPVLKRFIEQWDLQLLILPAIILIAVFSYVPMWGILIAFKDYDIMGGFFKSPWVGLDNFKELFANSEFLMIMRNTLSISFLKLIFGFPAPIILALMLNEINRINVKRVFQTVSYMPYFISWVIISGFSFSLLSVDNGSINILLMKLNLIHEPVNWLVEPKYFWAIYVITGIWKNLGYGSIIYLAAISGINPELYESAEIDGASRIRQIINITLPCITPVILIFLILNLGGILNAGFEEILALTNNGDNAALRPVAEVIDTYVYKYGIQSQRYSYATAVGLFRSVVNMIILFTANSVTKRISGTRLL